MSDARRKKKRRIFTLSPEALLIMDRIPKGERSSFVSDLIVEDRERYEQAVARGLIPPED